ncbi:LCP family protein [Ectobacillus ponti]|uniref:LCP family protein n=1 Tax=Ectobacillus ponti TaxID=2961894 RepID=A0AA41XAW9_9BACI|nr:LCP family protein [Ectobacillus ponti]MCP8969488.1 LCP family protein [Ectobacillus ponti]
MKSNLRQERNEKRSSRKRRIMLLVILPLLLIIGGAVGYGSYIYNKARAVVNNSYKELDRGTKSNKREETVQPLKDNVSILIMGVDESEQRKKEYGDAVRTDALLVATINKTDKSVKLLSIPRDTRVYIPSRQKKDKINHAHVFGGVDSTIETVEGFLDIPIDYYVKFNFESFIKIVDTLGGIDMDVPVTFTEQNSKDQAGAVHLKKGYQHLNGEQALALARTRHIDSDQMRGQRQQLVLEAIANKALSAGTINKLGPLIDAIGTNMKTNLTFDDIMAIGKNMAGSNLNMEKVQIEGEDQYIDKIYYYVPKEESVNKLSELLQQHLGVSGKEEHKTIK